MRRCLREFSGPHAIGNLRQGLPRVRQRLCRHGANDGVVQLRKKLASASVITNDRLACGAVANEALPP